ncbi:hypothetical protein [Eilatimonas milleporae]|uniref:Uncharacterized protein n=1 Tax=Eilatimonas milleporae TaxID=911205 RepID=A0A3M0CI08_9PROT|nr:hypothetical protein [Eilatimonas milleporae]RMB02873.1 hypothetical protein BXY39_3225 [Eilatimonas milleporae]
MSRTFAERYCPLDRDLPSLGALDAVTGWWRGLISRTPAPRKDDIDFKDLRGWHAKLTLAEVLPDCSDMIARIVGEDVAFLYRGQLKRGVRFGDMIDVSPDSQAEHIRKIVLGNTMALNRGLLLLSTGQTVKATAIDFPLAAAPGKPVHIITFYDFRMPGASRQVVLDTQ